MYIIFNYIALYCISHFNVILASKEINMISTTIDIFFYLISKLRLARGKDAQYIQTRTKIDYNKFK